MQLLKSRTIAILLLAGGLGTAVGGAYAATLPALNGNIYFNFTGIEQFSMSGAIEGAGGQTFSENNWGIVQVDSIYSASGSDHKTMTQNAGQALWTPGAAGGQVFGIFYNINSTNANGNSKGGEMDLYWIPYANLNLATISGNSPISKLTAVNQFSGLTDAQGAVRLVSVNFTTGAAWSPPFGADSDWKNITVDANTGSPSLGHGSATSYLNVNTAAGGAWAAAANQNWFQNNGAPIKGNLQTNYAGYADMMTNDNYIMATSFNDDGTVKHQSAWDNGNPYYDQSGNPYMTLGLQITSGSVMVAVSSSDRLVADTVPEPGTLATLSLGLTGLAFGLRRRRS